MERVRRIPGMQIAARWVIFGICRLHEDSVFSAFPGNVLLTNSGSWLVIISVPYPGQFL